LRYFALQRSRSAHQTISLSKLLGINQSTITLIWNKYEVEGNSFIPDYYYIYRGMDSTNLYKYDSISGYLSSYNYNITDALEYEFYQISIAKEPCEPLSFLKASSGPFSQSLSNLEDNRLKQSGINAYIAANISIYPNPFKTKINIRLNKNKDKANLILTDIAGKKIEQQDIYFEDGLAQFTTNRELSAGVYIIHITGVGFSYSVKLSKEE